MDNHQLPRREFLKMLAAAFPAAAIHWEAFPYAHEDTPSGSDYDAIVIGAGLGGLSCGAAFARQGYKALVIEQHDKPGGFATAFPRPGGFLFEVSLHATGAGQRNGAYNLIQGFPEITDVEFLPHPSLFRAVFPEHDLRVPQRNPEAYIGMLEKDFPAEKEGIRGLFGDMQGLAQEVGRLSAAGGNVDMSRFPTEFPHIFAWHQKTWGDMVNARLTDPKLKGIVSAQWAYYGLPPSRLSCFYYALPFLGYLHHGGFYPKGRSQDISNALARFIRQHNGEVLLNTRVDKILLKEKTATGVMTADGKEFRSKVVVSNASPHETFQRLIADQTLVAEQVARWKQYSVSLSMFQVFLGLDEDLVGKLGIKDAEIFVETSYDPEAAYGGMLAGDVEHGGVCISAYDALQRGYSPAGKNTINLLAPQGYSPWEKYEKDYQAGDKTEYRKEKERMADILIAKAEKALLPGLSQAIRVKEIATPLTMRRYTGHYRGAAYGWDQTVNNSGAARVGHSTPIKNLFVAGAWSRPGHGFGAVIPSGLECFAEAVKVL